MKTINRILPAMKVNMGGIMLDQPLPHRGVEQVDPFLLIHHWSDKLKGGERQQDLGVGPHPHRGFAPVTFIFKGGVHHRDSTGVSEVVSAGGTQWMNSGRGIVHSERPNKELAQEGGDFELIQFWVNAPAKHKMDEPNYQPLTAEQTPVVKLDGGAVEVGVVAGELNGTVGKVDTYSDLLTLRLTVKKGGKASIPVPKHYNTLLYQLDGKLTINNSQQTKAKDMAWFNNDGDEITVEAYEDTRAILLAGAPINEQISTYGPFVMNTQAEIMQALHDYQSGKMGTLVETFE